MKLFLLFLLIQVIQIIAAPIETPNLLDDLLKDHQNITKTYHSSFFDQNLKKVCEVPNSRKIDNGLCLVYADVLIKLDQKQCNEITKKNWADVDKSQEPEKEEIVCEKLSQQLGLQKSTNQVEEMKLATELVYNKTKKLPVCKKMCYEENYDETTENIVNVLRPICKFILFGYTQLSTQSAMIPTETTKKVDEKPVLPAQTDNSLKTNNTKFSTTTQTIPISAKEIVKENATVKTENREPFQKIEEKEAAIETTKSEKNDSPVVTDKKDDVEKPPSQVQKQNQTVSTEANKPVKLPDPNDLTDSNGIEANHEIFGGSDDGNDSNPEDDLTDDYPDDTTISHILKISKNKPKIDYMDSDISPKEDIVVEKDPFVNTNNSDSDFLNFLLVLSTVVIVLYIVYHNRHKLLALLLEGKRNNRTRRDSKHRNKGYTRLALDSNLEEAITSKKSLSTSEVIY